MKLLFEIGTEELPADYVDQGLKALQALVEAKLKEARLDFGQIEGFATPRRLALRVSDLAERQARLEAERRGPPPPPPSATANRPRPPKALPGAWAFTPTISTLRTPPKAPTSSPES